MPQVWIDDKPYQGREDETLLELLLRCNLAVSTACGGQAICHLCRVVVTHGGGAVQDKEVTALGDTLLANNIRLSCQVWVAEGLRVTTLPRRPGRPPPNDGKDNA